MVCDFIGYGIGNIMYEVFIIFYYGKVGKGICLKEGMVIIIELMVNVGIWYFKMDKNGWIVCIIDGKLFV